MKQPVGGSQPAAAYSPGIVAEGRHVYVSGQTALRDGVPVGETVEAQTVVTLEHLGAVLERAGATLADVVKCGVFLADLADFAAMNEVYARTFPQPFPARSTVGAALAPGLKVEIDCVAVVPLEREEAS